ncbi:hypothetical protein D3C80_1545490 [compost metagenome]
MRGGVLTQGGRHAGEGIRPRPLEGHGYAVLDQVRAQVVLVTVPQIQRGGVLGVRLSEALHGGAERLAGVQHVLDRLAALRRERVTTRVSPHQAAQGVVVDA